MNKIYKYKLFIISLLANVILLMFFVEFSNNTIEGIKNESNKIDLLNSSIYSIVINDDQLTVKNLDKIASDNIVPLTVKSKEEYEDYITDFILYQNENVEKLNDQVKWFTRVSTLFLLLFIFSFLLGVYVNYHYYLKPLLLFENHFTGYVNGDVDDELITGENNIISPLTKSFNALKRGIDNLAQYAESVGEGNYDNVNIAIFGDNSRILSSFNKMKDSLLEKSQKEKQDNWIVSGIAYLSEVMRDNSSNLDELSRAIVVNLSEYMNACQAAIFITNKEENVLEMKAKYAYERDKYEKMSVKFGEGLVGEVAKSNKYLNITNVPENYMRIKSSLGDDKPKNIIIVPLEQNGDVFGVIEMATLHIMPQHEIELLRKVADALGSIVNTILINSEAKKYIVSN